MTQEHRAELVKVEPASHALAMQMKPSEALRRLKELQTFVAKVMVEGEDYGKIPGLEKKTLLQPGAQKLAEIYGIYPTWQWTEVVKDWEKPFFYFESKCILRRKADDTPVGEGLGSCNSRESKYAGRWVAEGEVPSHLDKSTLETRMGSAWVFERDVPAGSDFSKLEKRGGVSKKNGRPWTQWRVVTKTYLLPNADLCSQVNTMQKIAAKRSLVMAVIGATRSSGMFTQDVEDMPKEAVKPDVEVRGDDARGETDTYQPPAEQPRKPKGKVAVDLAHPERRKEHVQRLSAYLEGARDIDDLKAVWAQVMAAGREGFLDRDERAGLEAIKDRRKSQLEIAVSTPNTTTDGNADWGIGADADAEPPADVRTVGQREPGEEG